MRIAFCQVMAPQRNADALKPDDKSAPFVPGLLGIAKIAWGVR